MADSATIDIRGDNSDLKKKLDESKKMFDVWGVALKATAVAAAAAFAVNFARSFAQDKIQAFKEDEQAAAKLQAVLKATGNTVQITNDELLKMAANMQAITKFGDEVLVNAQAVLATFTQVKGDQFREAFELAVDMAEVLGGDVQGAVLQVGKALNDPVKGMAALSRSGVSFTQEQKATVAQLQKANDLIGAQKVILDELRKEFGGAAQAVASTGTGELEKLTNAIGDADEAMGKALVPIEKAFLTLELDFKNSIAAGAEALWGTAEAAEESAAQVEKVDENAKRAEESAARLREQWAKLEEAQAKANEKIEGVIENIKTQVDVQYLVNQGLDEEVAQLEAVYDLTKDQRAELEAMLKLRDEQKATNDAQDLLDDAQKRIQALEDEVNGVSELERKYLDLRDAISGEDATGQKTLEELDEALKKLEAMEDAKKIGEEIAKELTDHLAEAWKETEVPEVKVEKLEVKEVPKLELDKDEFKASFVGLEEMQRKIQASAASGGFQGERLTQKQLQDIYKASAQQIVEMEAQSKIFENLVKKAEEDQKNSDRRTKDVVDAVKNIRGGLA